MAANVHQRIEYRGDTWLLRKTPLALIVLHFGLVMLLYDDSHRRNAGWILIAAGAGWVMFVLHRRIHPGKPLAVLSQRGLAMRLGQLKDILIPWREISDVSAVSFKAWDPASRLPFRSTYRDITAVTVSKGYYDQQILIPSRTRRGPVWDLLFRPKGDAIQVLLHHDELSVPAAELRHAVDTRWRAFTGRPELEPLRAESRPAAGGLYGGGGGGAAVAAGGMVWTPWQVIKFAVPLALVALVLANAMQVWETPEQVEARLERARVAEEERLEALERKRQEEEWKQFWKDVDRDLRRP